VLSRLHELRRRPGRTQQEASGARLEHRLRDRRNNFDVLRVLAASFVLFSHSYALTAHAEPFADITGWTLGELGVVMFFAMSGFLIAKSWSEQPHWTPFAVKRGLRLIPALVVAVSVVVLVVGPTFTVLPLGSYFTDPLTWTYLLRCSFLITIFGKLPGVFATNPYPDAVNGSLWTLPVEACCYAMAAALGSLGLLRRSKVLLALAVLLVLAVTPLSPMSLAPAGGTTSGNLPLVVMLVATFALGSLAYSVRARLHLSWAITAALVALWIATWGSGWARATGIVGVTFAVLVVAFRTPAGLRRLTAHGDVSYGIYIYAFPVQQSVAAIWGGIDPLPMTAVAFPVTYALAFLSWRLVERPALGLKRRVAPRASEPARCGPLSPSDQRSLSARRTPPTSVTECPPAGTSGRRARARRPGG